MQGHTAVGIGRINRFVENQKEGVSALVFQRPMNTGGVGVNRTALAVEKFRPNVKRLMDVPHKMGKQNEGDRLGDLARIVLAHPAGKNIHAIGNHVHRAFS